MAHKVFLLANTFSEYSERVHAILGKGRLHAGLVYEDYFRTGEVSSHHRAFDNAQALFDAICAASDFSLPLKIAREMTDGATGKILFQTQDNLEVESVRIPMQAGGTLCVSSQVGCRMGCTFCETGRMGLLRNLTVEEIVSQIFIARHLLGFAMRNIVFMGMGEPFDNYDNVMQAVRILTDPKGFGFGKRHLTVSTSGCVDGIRKMIAEEESAPNLAVSVNAPGDEERNRLMPINRRHNMAELYQAMNDYCTASRRQILIAYVLFKGLNDSLAHADRLAHYLRGLNVKVNLIPYNPQTRSRFEAPDRITLDAFAGRLREHGYLTLLRLTKGQEIMAACGQLGNAALRKALFQNQKNE